MEVDVHTTTVGEVKAFIAEKINEDVDRMIFENGSISLRLDDRPLAAYKVTFHSQLRVFIRYPRKHRG